MRLCPTCERPRIEGSKTCSGCGRPYPAGISNLPDIVGFGRGKAPTRARSQFPLRPAVLVAIAIVLVVAASGAAWLLGRHKPSPVTGPALDTTSPATAPAAVVPSDSPSPPPPSSPANAGQGLVTVTEAAAQDSSASPVAAFLDKYFTAINSHSYHAYEALFIPQIQQGLTRAGFNSGYPGTIDSAIELTNISTAIDGDIEAVVKFTSHQTANAADNQESCTNWSISLFLTQDGGEYLIDRAPPGYHAASAPCS